jgi:hypothetical protein
MLWEIVVTLRGQISNQKYVNHICKLTFSSSHIFKKVKGTDGINVCIIRYSQDVVISRCSQYEKLLKARHWWLKPVILATQEAVIRSTAVQSQPRQIVCETLS